MRPRTVVAEDEEDLLETTDLVLDDVVRQDGEGGEVGGTMEASKVSVPASASSMGREGEAPAQPAVPTSSEATKRA